MKNSQKNNTTETSENINTTRVSFGQRLKTDIEVDQIQPLSTRKNPFSIKKSQSHAALPKRPLIHQEGLVWENIYKLLFEKKMLQTKEKKKQQEKLINDNLVRETGFPTLNRFTNPQTQRFFQMYLDGQINEVQMVAQVNKQDYKEVYAKVRGKRLSHNRRKMERPRHVLFPIDGMGPVKQIDELKEFTNRVRSQFNIQKIRDVIISRMQQKVLNTERSQSLSHLGIFRSMYDASEDCINKISERKKNLILPQKSSEQQWSTMKLIIQKRDNPSNQDKQPKNIALDAKITQGARIKLIDENIEQLLEEERAQIHQQEEQLKREIHLKNRFLKGQKLTQQIQTEQEKDIRLQKYLQGNLSPYKKKQYYLGRQVTHTKLDKEDEAKTFNVSIKKKNKEKKINRVCPSKMHSEDSGNSSLQSANEIKIDELYDESLNLQGRLTQRRFQDGFGKTIRTVQRLQELSEEISYKTKLRLSGLKQRNTKNEINL